MVAHESTKLCGPLSWGYGLPRFGVAHFGVAPRVVGDMDTHPRVCQLVVVVVSVARRVVSHALAPPSPHQPIFCRPVGCFGRSLLFFLLFFGLFPLHGPCLNITYSCGACAYVHATTVGQLVWSIWTFFTRFDALYLWCNYVWVQGVARSLKRFSGAKILLELGGFWVISGGFLVKKWGGGKNLGDFFVQIRGFFGTKRVFSRKSGSFLVQNGGGLVHCRGFLGEHRRVARVHGVAGSFPLLIFSLHINSRQAVSTTSRLD